MAFSIIQLYVLSGCDHNSGFYGVSRKAVVDRIEKSSDRHKLLQGCGSSLPVGDETINDITKFVIRYVYSDVKSNNLPDARAIKWRSQKKICQDYHPICILLEHILSVLITWPTYKLIMR